MYFYKLKGGVYQPVRKEETDDNKDVDNNNKIV
jgi:hypothetical protein